MKIVGQDMVGAGRAHLVEQHGRLNGDDKQQHQRREDVDGALSSRTRCRPYEIDGDVAAAVARRGDAPEDEYAQQQTAEVVGIGNGRVEQVAKQDGNEDVDRDDPNERSGGEFNAVNEPVHRVGCRAPSRGDRPRSRTRAIFGDCSVELAKRGVGIGAGLFHRRRPACFQRLDRRPPSLHLVGRELDELVRGVCFHLLVAGGFEVAPGAGDLHRPVGRAMVIDDLLLRGAHRVRICPCSSRR